MDCTHKNSVRGSIYEYCPDCGAVRKMDRPGKPGTEWHSCYLCRYVDSNKLKGGERDEN